MSKEASSQLTGHGAGFAAKLGVVFVRAVPAIVIKILEGIISGYKKFISVLIPALKGCEASRWKANTDRSLTFCRHLASHR